MKKVCPNCSKEFNAGGNRKYCNRECGHEYRVNQRRLKDVEVEAEVVVPPLPKVWPEIISEYAGVAWLRLYRIDQELAKTGRVKVIFTVEPDGKMSLIESLSKTVIGSGHLFDDRTPPETQDTWAGIIFVDSILTDYISNEGAIKLALLFQYYDDGTDKMKITQMVPREAVGLVKTKIGHGSSRTSQIADVKDWINTIKNNKI